MKKIILLQASLNNDESSAATVSNIVGDEMKALGYSTETIDLNKTEFSEKGLNGNTLSTYFDNSEIWINKLKEADLVVLSTSMTNFGYTSTMKNLIDKICVANKSFKYKYDGSGESEGLIKTNAVIITSQGAPKGWYPFGDHTIQLNGTLQFLGFNVVDTIVIDGTKTKEKSSLPFNELIETYRTKIDKCVNLLKNLK